MSIGDTLADARRQAGLTVTQVADRTRIRETIIRGIEQDDFSACGGDFYARGHIRSIASVVGIDPVPLIREYDEAHGAPEAMRAADVFEPSTIPESAAASTKDAVAPHAPEEPSTCTQSVALPVADSNMPSASTTATAPAAKPAPFMGREARSAISPVTSVSGTGTVTPPPVSAPVLPLAEATRTSRNRTGCALAGTDQVSSNWTRPSALYLAM